MPFRRCLTSASRRWRPASPCGDAGLFLGIIENPEIVATSTQHHFVWVNAHLNSPKSLDYTLVPDIRMGVKVATLQALRHDECAAGV